MSDAREQAQWAAEGSDRGARFQRDGHPRSLGASGEANQEKTSDAREQAQWSWYERELGWAVTDGRPLRLRTGLRFDVLDVPAAAGIAVLRRMRRTGPVARMGDRILLLVAADSAEELPGLLDWLEWGGIELDLRAHGAGRQHSRPAPPACSERPSAPQHKAGGRR